MLNYLKNYFINFIFLITAVVSTSTEAKLCFAAINNQTDQLIEYRGKIPLVDSNDRTIIESTLTNPIVRNSNCGIIRGQKIVLRANNGDLKKLAVFYFDYSNASEILVHQDYNSFKINSSPDGNYQETVIYDEKNADKFQCHIETGPKNNPVIFVKATVTSVKKDEKTEYKVDFSCVTETEWKKKVQ